MPRYPPKLTRLLLLTLAFVCLHMIAVVAFRSHATAATYPFMVLAPVLALIASLWRVRITRSSARLPWILLSVGLFLWTAGIVLFAWEDLFPHISVMFAYISDFAFFLYGVPVLLAISSPAEGQRIPLFIWLDGIQAVLTAYLTYITLFGVVPFSGSATSPMPSISLMQVYNIENLVLACAATLRVLAQSGQEEEKHFFQTLCSFLWVYAICAGVYNYHAYNTDGPSLMDVLTAIPFLALAVIAWLPMEEKEGRPHIGARQQITLFIDNASPIFYTLALLALGVAILRTHFYVGIAAIVVALAVYGLRTTTLQSRYMQSQQALQAARDRLEEMSLKDALTNVANRRHFDLTLEDEWDRAVRTQDTLSLLLIDIDYFKNLNDRYGHQHGDHCLVDISAALYAVLVRSGDFLARYGGEEFAVILPATDIDGAKLVANRLQDAVRSLHIDNETSIGPFATISIGIALYEFPHAGSPTILIEAADRALYLAKKNGRNQIEISSMQAVFDARSVNLENA
jgi:diguanylate cyclase (GGDEF)-like protein